jgi:hypothetical protein
MEGISIDACSKSKSRLTGPDPVFLALLELSGRPSAARDIRGGTDCGPGICGPAVTGNRPGARRRCGSASSARPAQDWPPIGVVFETRIVNTRTNLSLNFEERSTGFIWFFSFLVWYSDVRRRHGENLVILLDDPGLGLHAKAQWDLLRYIHERLAPYYQVLYATHSPFMIDPDRIPWVRTVEEVAQDTPEGGSLSMGTKVGDEALSTDHDTLLPLQASVGYRIVQDLDGGRRLLLVEKPSDVIYLQWFAARLREKGRTGLRSDWTIVPCGDLTRLATLVGLLARGPSRFAALLSLSHKHPDVAGQPHLAKMFNGSGAFPLHKYAEPVEATVEDLIGSAAYLALVDLCYGLPRKLRLSRTLQVESGAAVLGAVSNHFAAHPLDRMPFDSLAPAEYLLTGSRRLRKLPGIEEALARFERLFTDLD